MLHLDADLVRTFLAIVDTGSFSGAAARIGRTPSAVSMQVKRLEEELGRRLFERDSRTVRLSAHAEQIVPQARRWIEDGAALLDRMSAPGLTGEIAIGIAEDYAGIHMPSILKRFSRTHPELRVEVTCNDSRTLLGELRAGRLEAALVTETDLDDVTGLFSDHVHTERIGWLGAVDGRAAYKRPVPVAAAHPSCLWRQSACSLLERAGLEFRMAYTSALSTGQLAAVAADLAVAPLPLCLANGRVGIVPPEAGLPELPLTRLAYVRRSDANPAVQALHAHVRDVFGTGEGGAAALAIAA